LAIRDAHQRGLIHGALAPWTLFYDPVKNRLSAVDFGLWSLENFNAGAFCPPELLGKSEDLQPSPASDIHNLARLLIFLALSPEESTRERPNFETIPAFAIATLERSIHKDVSKRPQTIDDFLRGLSFHPPTTKITTSNLNNLHRGRVRNIESFDHPSRGTGIRFFLDEPNSNSSDGVFCYEAQNNALFKSFSKLWEGAELNLIAPRQIKDSQGRKFLSAQETTLPV